MKKNIVVVLIAVIILTAIAITLLFIDKWSTERKNNKEIAKEVSGLDVEEKNTNKEDNEDKNVEDVDQENKEKQDTDKESNIDKNVNNDTSKNVNNNINKDTKKNVEDNKKDDVDEYSKVPNDRPAFEYDRVIVMVTLERTRMNKEYTAEEFSEIEIISIENNRDYNFSEEDLLTLYLKNPGKENVLNAIEKLNTNSIVKYAEVSGIEYMD